MSIYLFIDWSGVVTRSLLIVMYVATLIHVRMGSKYTAVTYLILILILNNASGIVLDFAAMSMLVHHNHTHFLVWAWSLSFALMNLTFNISHFELAWIYKNIAHNVPQALSNQHDQDAYQQRQLIIYWVLMTLNIVFPLLGLVIYVVYWNALFFQKTNQT